MVFAVRPASWKNCDNDWMGWDDIWTTTLHFWDAQTRHRFGNLIFFEAEQVEPATSHSYQPRKQTPGRQRTGDLDERAVLRGTQILGRRKRVRGDPVLGTGPRKLPRAARALKAWRRLCPSQSR